MQMRVDAATSMSALANVWMDQGIPLRMSVRILCPSLDVHDFRVWGVDVPDGHV